MSGVDRRPDKKHKSLSVELWLRLNYLLSKNGASSGPFLLRRRSAGTNASECNLPSAPLVSTGLSGWTPFLFRAAHRGLLRVTASLTLCTGVTIFPAGVSAGPQWEWWLTLIWEIGLTLHVPPLYWAWLFWLLCSSTKHDKSYSGKRAYFPGYHCVQILSQCLALELVYYGIIWTCDVWTPQAWFFWSFCCSISHLIKPPC